MADALASGASVRKDVRVQVPPRALGIYDFHEAKKSRKVKKYSDSFVR